MPKVDVKEFAERVERICDFFLARISEAGDLGTAADDKAVLQKLKEDAADLQFQVPVLNEQALEGLSDYLKGLPPRESESRRTQ